MTGALGIVLVVLLLGLLAVALRTAIASPFRALGILVAGMAVHNFLLMILLRLGTPDLLVRLIQAWKEIVLLALPGGAVWTGPRRWQADRPVVGLGCQPAVGLARLHLSRPEWAAGEFFPDDRGRHPAAAHGLDVRQSPRDRLHRPPGRAAGDRPAARPPSPAAVVRRGGPRPGAAGHSLQRDAPRARGAGGGV